MFMTPLIFHAIDFSASQVGSGLAVAALIGTVVRLLSGALLDRGIRCSWPVRFTTLLAITADCVLIRADSYSGYLLGQLLLGCAAGLYWPAIELAVPLSCGSVPSGRGYALVRSADALGIGLGALIGTLAATLDALRIVYAVEALCMGAVLVLISLQPLMDGPTVRDLKVRDLNSALPHQHNDLLQQGPSRGCFRCCQYSPSASLRRGSWRCSKAPCPLTSCAVDWRDRDGKPQQCSDRAATHTSGQPAMAGGSLACRTQRGVWTGPEPCRFQPGLRPDCDLFPV